jgi:hypothetical protein
MVSTRNIVAGLAVFAATAVAKPVEPRQLGGLACLIPDVLAAAETLITCLLAALGDPSEVQTCLTGVTAPVLVS